MDFVFHQQCPRFSGSLTLTAPTAVRLWETFTFTLPLWPYRQLAIGRICWKNTQKLTQFIPRSHPRHLVGKKDSTKYDTIKDITSDSQVNRNFPYSGHRLAKQLTSISTYFFSFVSNKNNKT